MMKHANSIAAEHVHCATCGYDVFGQPIAGRCPECGSAIADSLASGLAAIDPAALRKMRWGARCLVFETTSIFTLFAVGIVLDARNEIVAWPLVIFALIAIIVCKPLAPLLVLSEQRYATRRWVGITAEIASSAALTLVAALLFAGPASHHLLIELLISPLFVGASVGAFAIQIPLSELGSRVDEPTISANLWVSQSMCGVSYAIFGLAMLIITLGALNLETPVLLIAGLGGLVYVPGLIMCAIARMQLCSILRAVARFDD